MPGNAKTARDRYRGGEDYFPDDPKPTLSQIREAAQCCKGCDLYRHATQTVFGEGARRADIMLIGEQPGDQEDLQGHPFVGPAGALLDKALGEAGLNRKRVYLTNVVKHFKWTPAPRGKKRLHAKPTIRQTQACRPWLDAEIRLVKPKVIVLLGATAAQSLLGRRFRLTARRGKPINAELLGRVVATWHPSAVLRAPDDAVRHRMFKLLVDDLKVAATIIKPH